MDVELERLFNKWPPSATKILEISDDASLIPIYIYVIGEK